MDREKRKDEHVAIAKSLVQSKGSDFDKIHFIHDALVDIDRDKVSLETTVFNQVMNFPLYINAMTGGSKKTGEINEQLAKVACEVGLMMAVGSQKAALEDTSLVRTFQCVREINPQGFILANVGVDSTIKQARAAIDMIQANALQIHLNRPQELVMPEGDRKFSSWSSNIKEIVESVNVPVVVKEVGFGLSARAVEKLKNLGVQTVDLAGRGGTNFIEIEDTRRQSKRYEYLYDYGLTTVESLLQTSRIDSVQRLASGGVRNPLDVVKCLALGARSVGMAGNVLKMIDQYGVDQSIGILKEWIEDIQLIMTLLGARNLDELRQVEWSLEK